MRISSSIKIIEKCACIDFASVKLKGINTSAHFPLKTLRKNAPVAQLDRAFAYEAKG